MGGVSAGAGKCWAGHSAAPTAADGENPGRDTARLDPATSRPSYSTEETLINSFLTLTHFPICYILSSNIPWTHPYINKEQKKSDKLHDIPLFVI